MVTRHSQIDWLIRAAALTLLLPLAACNVDVEKKRDGDKANVEIRTPVGGLSVRTNEGNNTGLAAYPGARPLRDDGDAKNANVDIGTSWFGLKVAAAKFETDDAPEGVASFYRREMRTYGEVTECNGDLDWRRDRFACKERPRRHEIQLGVG